MRERSASREAPRLQHCLGSAVECRIASTNTLFLARTDSRNLLQDFEFDVDIKFSTVSNFLGEIFVADDVIHRRSDAWTQEVVTQFLADNDVLAAATREEVHASSHFAVCQKRSTRHRVVPISIDATKWKNGDESISSKTLHRDARAEGIRQPNKRTDSMPEIVAR